MKNENSAPKHRSGFKKDPMIFFKLKTLMFLFVLFFSPALLLSQNNFTDGYPMQVGNVFTYYYSTSDDQGFYKIIIRGDTVINGKWYFIYNDGSEDELQRLDSANGNLYGYDSYICSGEYLIDSLRANLNDHSRRCTGRELTCTEVNLKNVFGNPVPTKNFYESYVAGPSLVTINKKYSKGFGQIYYWEEADGPPMGFSRTDTLKGCVINGVLYGDTAVPNGIIKLGGTVPEQFQLRQNYPNPFNPSTNIVFDVPKKSFINVVIYDILGREVVSLINEELTAGKYSVTWDASNYPSGLYFYRLTANDFTGTRKMILLK